MARASGSKAAPMQLSSPISALKGIGPRRARALAEEGIATLEDFLLYLPFRYEDRSRFAPIAGLSPGVPATVRATIVEARLLGTRIRGFTLYRAKLEDSTGHLDACWYNQPYLGRILKRGAQLVLFGAPSLPEKGPAKLLLKNPQFELVGEDAEGIHSGRIVPVYRRLAGLSTRSLRTLMHRALAAMPEGMEDPLPASTVLRMGLEDRRRALCHVHFPPQGSEESLLQEGMTRSHRRLALEELYSLQRSFVLSRRNRASLAGILIPLTPDLRCRLASLSPFPLTAAQDRALQEILRDLEQGRPMARLLQGDVGCGKTLVALLAAVAVMERGHQVAWMVPTEILAEQHATRAQEMLGRTKHEVALLTGQSPSESRAALLASIREGRTGLIVGTQALIQKSVQFGRLAFVVVDEQHRFGVRQREMLRVKGSEPHQLTMTATPIPRSLAMALYGDLDVSVIDAMPPGRRRVRTALRHAADREKIYRFIREEVERGGRAAIVVPAVQGRGRPLEGSAVRTHRHLSEQVFRDLRVALLHGRLSAEDRRRAVGAFTSGEAPVLVATTVLEVGIDVPDASVMVVEQADRFGLAQLHQIRGRVGRGTRPSWCILIPGENPTPMAEERLKTLAEITDGFEIARRDLSMRGPGELLGLRQSGIPDFRVADLTRDLDLLEIARQDSLAVENSLLDP